MQNDTRLAAPVARRRPDRALRRVLARSLILLVLLVRQPCAGHAADGGPFQPQPRIVNGIVTPLYPTTGDVLFGGDPFDATDVATECSGVLVGCETVLTAAHCVCQGDANTASTCLAQGLVDPSNLSFFLQHAGVFPVATITINPLFQFAVRSDIAVLKLATPVSGIAPSRINTTESPARGTAGTIVGFGITLDQGVDSGVKRAGKVVTQFCTVPISNRTSVCWDFVEPLGLPGSNSNTCNGDSGGPLFIDFGAGDQVAGLTSGGTPQCVASSTSWDDNVFNDRAWVQAEAGADLDRLSCGDLPQVGGPGTAVTAATGQLSSTQRAGRTSFQVPPGTQQLRVALNGSDADMSALPSMQFNDFDLYIKAGSPPTTTDYDCRDIGAAPYGFCAITAPAPGTWYVLIDWVEGAGTYQVTATTFAGTCAGDCNADGHVTVDELVTGVNIALGSPPRDACQSLDSDGNGVVTVDELVRAVHNALSGCNAG
jgi:secreted trypsin-like serine protease